MALIQSCLDPGRWQTDLACFWPTNVFWLAYHVFKICIIGQCLKLENSALASVAQWIERGLQTEGSQVRFPVRAQAWAVGQVPSRGRVRGKHIDVFLPLFLLPFPVSKNK